MASLTKWIVLVGSRPSKDADGFERYMAKSARFNRAGGDDYAAVYGGGRNGRRP